MNKHTMVAAAIWICGGLVAAGGAAYAIGAGSAPAVSSAASSAASPTASPAASATPSASPSASPSPSPSSDSSSGSTSTVPAPRATTDDGSVASGDIDEAIRAALAAVGPGVVIEADTDDDATHAYEIDIVLDAGGAVEVKLDASFVVVSIEPDDIDDDVVTDQAAIGQVSAVALAHVGAGTVVSVEASDDDDHAWEVEIDLGNGEDVDVELDAQLNVLRMD